MHAPNLCRSNGTIQLAGSLISLWTTNVAVPLMTPLVEAPAYTAATRRPIIPRGNSVSKRLNLYPELIVSVKAMEQVAQQVGSSQCLTSASSPTTITRHSTRIARSLRHFTYVR